MAALDFPTSPANGDKYPVPAVAGLPIYTWDGEKWTTVGGSVISGTPSNALPLMDNTPAVAGAATNYTREDHVHPVDTKAVRSDVATLWTPAQQQLARQNAYAAPFDAMAYGRAADQRRHGGQSGKRIERHQYCQHLCLRRLEDILGWVDGAFGIAGCRVYCSRLSLPSLLHCAHTTGFDGCE